MNIELRLRFLACYVRLELVKDTGFLWETGGHIWRVAETPFYAED